MTAFSCTPQQVRLATAVGPGLVGGNRIAVPAPLLPAESAGVLYLGSGPRADTVAVRLVPAPDLPPDLLVAPRELAHEHRLPERADWALRSAPPVSVAYLELEQPVGRGLEATARTVAASPLLSGHIFTLGDGGRDPHLDLDGTTVRVRRALDHSGEDLRGLLCVVPDTQVTLFAPGGHSGVDIVVLADCSGSMSVSDIPDERERQRYRTGGGPAVLSRMDALKSALRAMIDARERAGDVGTRFALLGFDTESRSYFPRDGGMAEAGAGSGHHQQLRELREAVSLLHEEGKPTDIGRALHSAGELLHRHGVPGNDRLVVLVSDGADWTPTQESKSGETVTGTADPVATMEDLHEGLGIRLHAVGVSEPHLFHSWLERERQAGRTWVTDPLVPNHKLLAELVDAAGGDRHRIGGVEVLEEYFAELGRGVARTVGPPAPGRLPPLQPFDEVPAPGGPEAVPGRAPEDTRAWTEAVDQLLEHHSDVSEVSRNRLGKPLFQAPDNMGDFTRLQAAADSRQSFVAWLNLAHQIFYERLPKPLRSPRHSDGKPRDPASLEVPALAAPLWDGRLGQLPGLRNYFVHARDVGGRASHNKEVAETLHRHTGQYHLREDDAEGWHRFQQGLVRDLNAMLGEIYDILNAPTEPSGGGGAADVPSIKTQGF